MNGGGTCFVFDHIYYVNFEMVIIKDSYNDYTTVGVKVIEAEVFISFFQILF